MFKVFLCEWSSKWIHSVGTSHWDKTKGRLVWVLRLCCVVVLIARCHNSTQHSLSPWTRDVYVSVAYFKGRLSGPAVPRFWNLNFFLELFFLCNKFEYYNFIACVVIVSALLNNNYNWSNNHFCSHSTSFHRRAVREKNAETLFFSSDVKG